MRSRLAEILLLVCVLVGLAIMTVAVVTVVEQGESISSLIAQRHTDQLAKNEENAEQSRNAAINRAVNVESWCEGINAINDYDRLIVRRAGHGAIVYTLANLPCERIIAETLNSAKTRTLITKQTHPLVYEALHPSAKARP